MRSTDKSIAGIFLDHLYFSVCCVLVGFLLVYFVGRWTEHGFDLDDYIAACVFIVARSFPNPSSRFHLYVHIETFE